MPAEHVPLGEALGRVLATDITATLELPPWDNASMDGYAVRAADVADASAERPVVLPVAGTIAAGTESGMTLPTGMAMRIMTGAPVPSGADSVIRVEDTDAGIQAVRISASRDAGRNVRPRGEDIMSGDLAARSGDVLHAGSIGFLASLGHATVPVVRRPRVAILASGDELVDVDAFAEVRSGRRIVSSNSYALMAAVRETGAIGVNLGHVGDDPAAIRERLASADCDFLITTGGVSVGEFDHTRSVLAELGASHRFWRVRIRPGAPLGFGVWRGRPWLGLPGNPVSTLVTYELFARPAIRRMLGHRRPFRRPVQVRLAEAVSISAPLTHFLRARLEHDAATLVASLTGPQGSGLLSSMARADALLIISPELGHVPAGQLVPALLLRDDVAHGEAPPTP